MLENKYVDLLPSGKKSQILSGFHYHWDNDEPYSVSQVVIRNTNGEASDLLALITVLSAGKLSHLCCHNAFVPVIFKNIVLLSY